MSLLDLYDYYPMATNNDNMLSLMLRSDLTEQRMSRSLDRISSDMMA